MGDKSDTYWGVSLLLYSDTASDISFLIQPPNDLPSLFAILSASIFKSFGITIDILVFFEIFFLVAFNHLVF